MADNVTKDDLKELKEFVSEQTSVILDAVDEKLVGMESKLVHVESRLMAEIKENRRMIKELTLTLDEFMKRVMHQDEEIAALNAKIDKIVGFIKDKFGVEITAQ